MSDMEDKIYGLPFNYGSFNQMKGFAIALLKLVGQPQEGVIVTPEERERLEDVLDDILEN
jgi:hypothetical protein